MKKENSNPYPVCTISDMHRLLSLPQPLHPLISVIDMSDIKCPIDENMGAVIYNFYSICTKKGFTGRMKYGQSSYDFNDGIMTFFSPGQIISTETPENMELSGMWLLVSPDFFHGYPIARNIKEYSYFSYAVHEALWMSDKEEHMVHTIMHNIRQEFISNIDNYSQDVLIAHVELLLAYSNRFYNRQFLTRKPAHNQLLSQLEELLTAYFNDEQSLQQGLPSVKYLAAQLHISPNYLGDMLRVHTGQSAQQHIHNKLIEKAKEILSTTNASVSEVAYLLGFQHPQSFNKLFKSKTNLTPVAFRSSFN